MKKHLLALSVLLALPMSSFANNQCGQQVPADKFDMSHWKITLPMDLDKNGRADEIEGVAMLMYTHPDYFFLDQDNNMVFEVPNMAVTTKGSTNARSELRQMARGTNTDINVKSPSNNWVLSSHKKASEYSSIGGTLAATLKVNHVSIHAQNPDKYPAYSVVVGQIIKHWIW